MAYTLDDFHLKAIQDYGLDAVWPQEVLTEAKLIPNEVERDKDFLDLPFVTIDGEDAKDFDDAIYCEIVPEGFNLKVAIADVSFYVTNDTPMDVEALRRSTSTYFPRKVIPMLPEQLSNDVCSLKPNKYRRAMLADVLLDKSGMIISYQFKQCMIRSAARLTYNHVEQNSFTGESYAQSLSAASILHKQLKTGKQQRGALDLNIGEPVLVFDKSNKVKKILPRSRLNSHSLIEEMMLIANICAADFLRKNYNESVFRNHEYPESIKIDRLSQGLKKRNINWNGSPEEVENLYMLAKNVSSRKDVNIIHMMILQAMQRAAYETKCKGHFGLKFDYYTHFTSPIRRYPDLIVHRLIKAKIDNLDSDTSQLETILEHCSQKEKDAEFASKQVIQNLICEHCKQFRGQKYSGFITGVKDFGLFIDIPDLYTTGMLHVSELPSDRYRFNARNQSLDGKRRGNRFALGDKIEVTIGEIFELEGKISLYY